MTEPLLKPRVLIVDDDKRIHNDYQRSLNPAEADNTKLAALEAEIFGEPGPEPLAKLPTLELAHAYQGQEAVELMRQALADGENFAIAFIDVRMPPGWDGITTTRHLLQLDPTLRVVICTAYSDVNWDDIRASVGDADVTLLRKPFAAARVRTLAQAALADA